VLFCVVIYWLVILDLDGWVQTNRSEEDNPWDPQVVGGVRVWEEISNKWF
jgi:hypothetical protein